MTADLSPRTEEVGMSHPIRRLTLGALLLACALTLAAPPAEARESPVGAGAPSWLEAVAQQVAQWAAGWWLPAHGAGGGQAARPSTRSRPPASVNCGGLVDPNGRCLPRPPVSVNCGGLVDPDGRCLPRPPASVGCGSLIDPDGRCLAPAAPRQ
jgi:hypothetical protein